MIVPDVNLLLYAEIDAFPHHARARRWWEDAMNGERQVGIAPVSLFGFLRIATNRRVLTDPMSVEEAIERAQRWLERPHVVLLVPGTRHLDTAFRLLRSLGTGGNLTTDVQIAAHAVEYNGEVYSNDQDFGRFEGVLWVNPLATGG
ncbi:MAG TPA: type II toxin-antitoxin system VapC family toxin [Thermoanaerobaculia bacterium]|nr:type II toxin-antitoxin system VapC family toxin [Thermoanaerobaculia bacterium]